MNLSRSIFYFVENTFFFIFLRLWLGGIGTTEILTITRHCPDAEMRKRGCDSSTGTDVVG